MSTARTYNLRVRSGAGVATQTSHAHDIPPPRTSPVPFPSDVINPAMGSDPDSGVVITSRTYSDVVASRPPSLRRERPLSPSESSVTSNDLSASTRVENDNPIDIEGPGDNGGKPLAWEAGSESDNPESQDESPWTTVQRQRAHGSPKLKKQKLTTEQAHSVQIAMEGMTASQKLALLRRQAKMGPNRGSSVSSREEGPSNPKGKDRDLRNWGGLNLGHENLDVEAHSVLKSGPVRFFCLFGTNRNHNRS
jgi:hypothetical protein